MVDRLTTEARSALMARIRGKDTGPEMVVRQMVHSMGYRYRLHRRSLPGAPDLVFAGKHKVIFVHGCFWHRHEGCAQAYMPKSRRAFWQEKLERNKRRDELNIRRLSEEGWGVLVVWECELASLEATREKVSSFLEGGST